MFSFLNRSNQTEPKRVPDLSQPPAASEHPPVHELESTEGMTVDELLRRAGKQEYTDAGMTFGQEKARFLARAADSYFAAAKLLCSQIKDEDNKALDDLRRAALIYHQADTCYRSSGWTQLANQAGWFAEQTDARGDRLEDRLARQAV
jgi:hypothetical protein